ncbi:MAG: DEAD/DEAH box helicase [Chloroflexi bacterium]|nr:DEAD/DEAH box helicase [Chloroflexota bacterium]
MDVGLFVDQLERSPINSGQLVHVEELPERQASHAGLTHDLHPTLSAALLDRGMLPLFTHQARAIDAVLDGHDVAVVTPAACGKSLCYDIPIAQAFLTDSTSKALFLFPTKALAQDQLRGLQELLPPKLEGKAAIFDGDTPSSERPSVRRSARAVLTNPDMLHYGMLPNHRAWNRLWPSLKYVVIDEAHVYRGIFGSHVANVLRRLRRLCAHYGSDPQFILSSATIANAGELAEGLIGRPAEVIAEDGAPHGPKHFVFWDPPIIDEERGTRASAGSGTSRLLEMLLKRDARTLAFVRTRRQAELVFIAVRDRLRLDNAPLAERVRPYRASYLAEDRREVERGLLDGQLLGVVATNALELSIDIGDLDATLITGYPGSIASTWQQAGRSGRSGQGSLSVLVAQDNPLDQYLMRHPDFFFGRPHEHARIRPENPYVLDPHLLCAAYEMPLSEKDAALYGDGFAAHVARLTDEGSLNERNGKWFISPSVEYPAQDVNIRSASHTQYLAVESQSGRVLEHLDESAAFSQLHPGAVYLHQGESYIVENLDLTAGVAYLTTTDVPYYTESRDVTDIRIVETKASKTLNGAVVHVGEVEVSRQVIGYRKRGFYSADAKDEDLGDELLDLPTRVFRTVAFWFDLPAITFNRALRDKEDLAGGLHAMEHAAIGVLPLFALCDRNDIGGVSTPMHQDTGEPQVFIYDGHPGGVGIAEHGFDVVEELLGATLAAIEECPCTDGCPSCVQSPKCGNNNNPLDKQQAAVYLRDLLGRG